ncbi:MAG: FecR domain-containing protein [Bacteroidales bacterium]|nr:FecR domain-containing protein [Bacteroidales bacterium]MBN2699014.1 FecR domain-containing protein [Bacteroidales bacterium]
MTNGDKIKKWLAGELSDAERKAFESTEEYAEINRLLEAVNHFKAPEYDVESGYGRLSGHLFHHKRTVPFYERISPVFRIAAIFVLALTIGYFSYHRFHPGSKGRNWISEQTAVYLPDSSFVSLNAGSRIRYSEKKWEKERAIELDGEAFFIVKNGPPFTVQSPQGLVTVLGTEFTVKDWEDFYQVTCYAGSVKVSARKNSVVLQPRATFRVVKGREETYRFSELSEPGWLRGESSFRSVPLNLVINELKRQYKVSVETRGVDVNQLFTGSFAHDNLEIALQAVTLPLHLNYDIRGNKIVITVEGK